MHHEDSLRFPVWEQGPHKEYRNLGSSFPSPSKTCKMLHPGSCITLSSAPIFRLETGREACGEEENKISMPESDA